MLADVELSGQQTEFVHEGFVLGVADGADESEVRGLGGLLAGGLG